MTHYSPYLVRMQHIQNGPNGSQSYSEVFCAIPSVDVRDYQCSPDFRLEILLKVSQDNYVIVLLIYVSMPQVNLQINFLCGC